MAKQLTCEISLFSYDKIYICSSSWLQVSNLITFFRITHYRRSERTHTHPYEQTHTNFTPTPSNFLKNVVLRFVLSQAF